MTSHIIPVSNGLFEHRERIGPAIWEFLWLIDRITAEEVDDQGERWGVVLGGAPVKHKQIAQELGTNERTVQRNLTRLKDEHYISSIRAPYGEIIRVAKNKKKVGERADKNVVSPPREGTKMSYLDPEIGQKCRISTERYDKSGISNKDITTTTTAGKETDPDPFETLFEEYCRIHQKLDIHVKPLDITIMTETIARGIPVPLIIHVMSTLHAERTAKGAKISSFAYYKNAIEEAWEAQKAITEGVPIPEGVPLSPVALGESSQTTPALTGTVAPGRKRKNQSRQSEQSEFLKRYVKEEDHDQS